MDPGVQGDSVSGGVPVLDPVLEARQHHLLQNVLHLPGWQERHPHLKEVDDAGKLQEREGGKEMAELGHPYLPHQTVIWVHAVAQESAPKFYS